MTKGEKIKGFLEEGLDNEAIFECMIVAGMPTTLNSIRWYRSKMAKKATKAAKKAPKKVVKSDKPVITLRNVKIHLGLSEETPCYEASVYVDGEQFCFVSNHGHGGCDNVWAPKGKMEGFSERLKALEERIAATYPKHEYDLGEGRKGSYEESLESLCHVAAFEESDKKSLKTKMARVMLTVEDGKVYQYKGKYTSERHEAMRQKKPSAIILNALTFDEAWDLYKEHA